MMLARSPSYFGLVPARGGGGERHLREVRVGVCRRGLQTLTVFKTKSVHFATLFKTRDLYILLVFCVFCLPCFSFPIQKVFSFFINYIIE